MLTPPNGHVWHKASFRWVRTRSAWTKMPTAPLAFPFLGPPQAPGNKPNLPQGDKSQRERPLETGRNLQCQDTLGQIRAAVNTTSRSATRQLKRCSITILRYLLLAPLNEQVWHKAFFGGSDRSPHAPGISQKCLRSRGHSSY